MALVNGPIDMVRNICGVKDSWRLKVRVVRLWKSCSKNDPKNVFSLEMVLVDVEGARIQESIRKPMIRKFANVIVEGDLYKMIYFAVVKNMVDVGLVNVFNTSRLLWNPQIVEAIEFRKRYKLKSLVCDRFETETSPTYPDELKEIVGKEILFKVQKNADVTFVYDDDAYKVKKICDDTEIIEEFKTDGSIVTPQKLKFVPKFSDMSSPNVTCEVSKCLDEEFTILTQPEFSTFEKGDSSSLREKHSNVSNKSYLEGMVFTVDPSVQDSVQDMSILTDSQVSTISLVEPSELHVNDNPDGKKVVDNTNINSTVKKRKLRIKTVKAEKD
ncbi:Nucleic acid-binding, OB-fold [Sesbania bispinosa]|nr:Nucleic acid-binding, OB-fold [Sesbania bispinosa]